MLLVQDRQWPEHYKAYQHEQSTQERLVYAQEEENARAHRVGLWKEASLSHRGNGGSVNRPTVPTLRSGVDEHPGAGA